MKRNPLKKMTAVLSLMIAITLVSTSVFGIEGVFHNPYGIDCLYTIESTQRYPEDPVAGENVFVKITTWPIEYGQATWVTWSKNGVVQNDVGGSWKYNEGNNSYWEANLGSFAKGDKISYTVHANHNGNSEKVVGPFTFTVTDWEYINSISSYRNQNNSIVLDGVASAGAFQPKINIAFTADDVFRVQMSPKGNSNFAKGLANYTVENQHNSMTITTSKLMLKINKNPYKMSVYKADGTLIAKEYTSGTKKNMAWLTDGNVIIDKVEERFYTPTDEAFFGFGEHYNNFNKRGQNIDTYVYNQYKNQNEKTYMAIPFMVTSKGYGIYANSTYYSQFRMATDANDMYSFTVNTGGKSDAMLDYYFISGNDIEDVVVNYTDITSKPILPPKEAFGVWMSANEWDRESEVRNALNQVVTHNIPASMIVLEQWSDEKTFYIFNDATYTATTGENALSYHDFSFHGRWSNPKALVNDIHDAGMNVLLWQVPLLKYTSSSYEQNDNDRLYMERANFAVKDGKGGDYKIPNGKWFSGSYLVDFTNQNAVNWWMSKREYLLDDIGIDGFKTDGGEMVWGRSNTFLDGRSGDEMRNTYSNEYIKAYYDFTDSKTNKPVTFSRSGTAGVQEKGVFWSGDQESTFYAFDQAVVAGLSSNLSGVSFMGWDLAGFTGNFPSSELYKRSAQQQAFGPIMQFHSEKASPSVSEERSPWNVAARNNDQSVMTTFTKFANMRYNLMPYIYTEAKKAADKGIPMMRAMVLEAPEDTATYTIKDQYMFGKNLLVAPIVVEGQTTKSIYLPEGEWYDIFHGGMKQGKRRIDYYADQNSMPVFAKAGAILPMNLNQNYEFGGTIGNDLYTYTNLTFRIYPSSTSSYVWYDDIGDKKEKTVTSIEDYKNSKVTIELPDTTVTTSLQIFSTKPDAVKEETTVLSEYNSLQALKSASKGWYYDKKELMTYVKVEASSTTRNIIIEGVHKASYEAEFAKGTNTSVNTNHTGYTGPGFVDGFASKGDKITFSVYAKEQGTYSVGFTYGAGANTATRSIYVNGTNIGDVTMPKTANWDTWAIANIDVNLQKGRNTITMQYDADNHTGINLDNIIIYE